MIMERVIFLTDNPLATKSFYRDVLELEIVEERDDSFTIGRGYPGNVSEDKGVCPPILSFCHEHSGE